MAFDWSLLPASFLCNQPPVAFLKPLNTQALSVSGRVLAESHTGEGRGPTPRVLSAEEKGSLWGLESTGCLLPGGGWGPAPSPRPLTYIGVLQQAADSSLSLQFLVIWGQKGTWCHLVPQQPVIPHAWHPQTTVC